MNFQDNLEKVRDLYVVLSLISIREITLYFLVHYKNMEHYNSFINFIKLSVFTTSDMAFTFQFFFVPKYDALFVYTVST